MLDDVEQEEELEDFPEEDEPFIEEECETCGALLDVDGFCSGGCDD